MKKTVSLLLLLTMLVWSVPMVILNINAADATPLTVTHRARKTIAKTREKPLIGEEDGTGAKKTVRIPDV